jgi:hypothetical protein
VVLNAVGKRELSEAAGAGEGTWRCRLGCLRSDELCWTN